MVEIFVPTYGKSELPILKLLEDESVFLHLCIRSDCDKSIYDDIRKLDRVDFIELGNGIKNLGETRKRIVQYCIDKGVKYCMMFDDGITSLTFNYFDIQAIYDYVIMTLNFVSKKRDLPICCYTFSRKGNKFLGTSIQDFYFSSLPLQAVLLDVEVLKKYGVNYEDMDVCGLEDVAFFMDCVKKGLVFVGNQLIRIDGKLPNVIVKGGSHEDTDVERFIKKRDEDHKRLMQYVGPTYGIMLTKKWRESLGFQLTYARIDFSYFRDVLVFHRKENEDLIKSGFRIK